MALPGQRIALAATALTLALTAACGKSAPPDPPPLPAPAPVVAMTITIDERSFSASRPITPGATVTVVNNDLVRHSVTSKRAGLFDYEILPRETVTFTAPTEPGVHPYFCKYHGFMSQALTIRA
ncbi:plastocyanin [Nocardia sp. NPDC127579]|uniref:plastocyanin n=1 Tax=Nocardia sp. NPDC127579 TaxID=3345402 RepID=UPI00363E20D9